MLEISSKATICDSVKHINVVRWHQTRLFVKFAEGSIDLLLAGDYAAKGE
tara:strand:- start:69 stop:218 length:150 start_codon:yes stop_codon:yes gene_type:complete